MVAAFEGGGPDRVPSALTLLKVAIVGGLIGEAAASLGEIVADAIDPWITRACGVEKDAAKRRVLLRHTLRALVLIAFAAVAIHYLLPRRF